MHAPRLDLLVVLTALALGLAHARADEEAPETTGSVAGRVLLRGIPAAGRVEVRRVGDAATFAHPIPGEPVRTVQADAEGRFRVADLPCMVYELRARVAGHMDASTYVTVREGRGLDVIVPVLAGPHRVTGTLSWKDGRPFEGHLRLSVPQYHVTDAWKSQEGAVAPVGPEGDFTFEALPAGTYSLDAFDGSRRFGLRSLQVPVEGAVVLQVDAEFRRVRGRVLDDATGEPVAATLTPQSYSGWDRAKTDEAGRFELWVSDDTDALVVCRNDDDEISKLAALPAESVAEVEVRLHAGGAVAGRVRDREGEPVEGARVWALRVLSDDGWTRQLRSTISDAKGRYRIEGVAVGEARVFALGSGWASRNAVPFGPGEGTAPAVHVTDGSEASQDLVLEPAASLELRVVDAEARPVRHAVVEVVPDWGWYSFLGSAGTAAWRWRRTDAAGRATFPVLFPGLVHHVEIEAPGPLRAKLTVPALASGETGTRTLALPAVQGAVVRVVDAATKAGIVGARLDVQHVRETAPNSTFTESLSFGAPLYTDATGTLRIEGLPQGTIRIEAEHHGHAAGQAELPASGQVTIALDPGSVLSGCLEGPEGLAGQVVTVGLSSKDLPFQAWIHRTVQVPVGEAFRFENLTPGRYDLSCTYETATLRCEAALVVEAPAEGVALRLARVSATRLDLRILGPDDEPVPRARVVVHEWVEGREPGPASPMHGMAERTEVEVRDGRFEMLLERDDGLVFVDVLEPRTATGEALDAGTAAVGGVRVESGEPLVIRLPEVLVLEGRVVDEEGVGVPGVRLRAHHTLWVEDGIRHTFANEPHGEAVSDGTGRFVIAGLGPLKYDVSVEDVEGFGPRNPFEVHLPQPPVTIHLQHAVLHRLRVLDPDGAPVQEARVAVDATWREEHTRHTGTYWEGPTDDTGAVRIPLPPSIDVRRLAVMPPPGREDLGARIVPEWTPASGDLVLPRGLAIEGTVVDSEGRPRSGVQVGLMGPGLRSLHLRTTDGRGVFRFAQLVQGTYHLAVYGKANPLPAPRGSPVEVTAGTRDVRLVDD